MLHNPTISKLQALKLTGMLKAYQHQQQTKNIDELSFDDRLGLLIDNEMTERDNRRLTARLKVAQLKQQACLEDIDLSFNRGIDKSIIKALSQCQWIKEMHNVLITGPTGSGKTYLACALAQKACRIDYTAMYLRAPRLFEDLAISRADGSYKRLLNKLARINLLIIDDFGLVKPNYDSSRDLLEVIDDRYKKNSTIITSQLPIENWHEVLGNPTIADAILDRVVHISYRVNLTGESMRKKKSLQLQPDTENK